MPALKVAALLSGEPGAFELWTLRAIAATGCALTVVQAERPDAAARMRKARSILRREGVSRTLSRAAGSLVARRAAAEERGRLDELLDADALRSWHAGAGLPVVRVAALNAPDSLQALSAAAPHLIVRVSGGLLKPEVLRLASVAALNIHHGKAPLIRGMWSIPWAVIEGRPDWIGATVHVMDAGIDTGPILWRGGPQLAPGDGSVELLFRAHLQAVEALARLIETYARGETPAPWLPPAGETSTYRSAPGLWDWVRYLRLERGKRARIIVERGIEC